MERVGWRVRIGVRARNRRVDGKGGEGGSDRMVELGGNVCERDAYLALQFDFFFILHSD